MLGAGDIKDIHEIMPKIDNTKWSIAAMIILFKV